MDTSQHVVPNLQAVFDGAKHFGLSDREVWRTIDESLHRAGGDATVREFVDGLTAALARRAVTKTRRTLF
jgi:hypothetical protein